MNAGTVTIIFHVPSYTRLNTYRILETYIGASTSTSLEYHKFTDSTL